MQSPKSRGRGKIDHEGACMFDESRGSGSERHFAFILSALHFILTLVEFRQVIVTTITLACRRPSPRGGTGCLRYGVALKLTHRQTAGPRDPGPSPLAPPHLPHAVARHPSYHAMRPRTLFFMLPPLSRLLIRFCNADGRGALSRPTATPPHTTPFVSALRAPSLSARGAVQPACVDRDERGRRDQRT